MTEKIFLANPYLKEISARIVNKKYIDGKYFLKLNRTIFYPNLAGGQPRDKGTINGIEVVDVYEEGEDIIHVIQKNIHSDKVKLCIDWNTRLDYMQQHTGQHLLSSVFYKLYNAETVGFHIGDDYVYIDVTLSELNKEIVEKVEIVANKIVYSNFSIKTYTIEKNNINKIPIRKNPKIKSNIRIVEIDGIDYSPCCGTHHRATGEIGMIKIRKWEKYKGNTRIEFVCGNRALKDYSQKNEQINNISSLLSSEDIKVFENTQKLYYRKEELEKENKSLKEELLKYKSEKLLSESMNFHSKKIIAKIFKDIDLKELSFMSSYLCSFDNIICLFGLENNDKGQFILCRNANLDINMKEIIKNLSATKNIKGGGSIDRVQGGCNIEDLKYVLNSSFESIKTAKA